LLDGHQTGALFSADDLRVRMADIVLLSPGQDGRVDPGVTQLKVLRF
jgi:hypothetical protein